MKSFSKNQFGKISKQFPKRTLRGFLLVAKILEMIPVLLELKNLPGMNYFECVKEITKSCTLYKIMCLLFGSSKSAIAKKYIAKANRVAGGFSPPAPTIPGMRVCTGRFIKLTIMRHTLML